MYALVRAETMRLVGNTQRAEDLYDQTVTIARASGWAHNEALAHELAGQYWIRRGRRRYARPHLVESLYLYSLWNSTRKVKLLRAAYPDLLLTAHTPRPLIGKSITHTQVSQCFLV